MGCGDGVRRSLRSLRAPQLDFTLAISSSQVVAVGRSVGRSAGLPARVHFARFVEITHIFASSRVTIICNSPTGPRGAEGAILSECICSTYLETTIEEVPIIADMNVNVEFVDYLTQVGIMRFESQRGRGIGGEGIIMRRSKEESDALIYSRCRPRRNGEYL